MISMNAFIFLMDTHEVNYQPMAIIENTRLKLVALAEADWI